MMKIGSGFDAVLRAYTQSLHMLPTFYLVIKTLGGLQEYIAIPVQCLSAVGLPLFLWIVLPQQ